MKLLMSERERERLKVLSSVERGDLKQQEAAVLLDISIRQTKRLLKRYREEGDKGLVHRLRGKRSNRRIEENVEKDAERLVTERYADFGPTLAGEYLEERHGLKVSHETLRKWMTDWGLWKPKRRRFKHYEWRERKGCFGEMAQMDTSEHDWFEGRGEKAYLILMIDDATSRIYARFYNSDSTGTNMDLLKNYLRLYGRPKAIYADKASHFMTTRDATVDEQLQGREAETQIQRALRELDIEYIPAHSPQAKGRVERSFRTAQNRLVKALRVEGIGTIEQANAYLRDHYIPRWNQKFAVKPSSPHNAHRPIKGMNLNAILSVQHTRVVGNDYTIQFHKRLLQIKKESITAGLRKGKVLIESRLDGSTHIRFRGTYLKFREIDPQRRTQKVDSQTLRSPGKSTRSLGLQREQQQPCA